MEKHLLILLVTINPFRYRGYVYDDESGLYYLQSRYYNPEWCRFINADSQLNQNEGFTGMNTFQYCGNNPVNRVDPSGHFWISTILATLFVASVIATAARITRLVCTVREINRVRKELSNLPEPTGDITETFSNTMKNNAKTIQSIKKEKGMIATIKAFKNKVQNQGEWDLKQLPEYKGGTFSFRGKTIQDQDIGNMNYGYVGKAMGLPTIVLLAGGSYAQVRAGTSNFSSIMTTGGDDLRDQLYILYGIILYETGK